MHEGVGSGSGRRRAAWGAIAACVLLLAGLFVARPWQDTVDVEAVVGAGKGGAGRPAGAMRAVPRGAPRGTAAVGAGSGPVPEADAQAEAVRQHLRSVARDGDPRQRLIALRLLLTGHDDAAASQRVNAIARSLLAQAPDDELIALMQGWFCGGRGQPACRPEQDEAWRRAAPGNGAAYLGTLDAVSGDAAATDAVLERAAAGDRFEGGMHALVQETTVAFDDLPLPPLSRFERATLRALELPVTAQNRRLAASLTSVFALPIPRTAPLVAACRPPLPAARARNCYVIARRMAGAPTLIERGVALAILERLTRGTREASYWADERADARWQTDQFSRRVTDGRYWEEVLRYGEVIAVRNALLRAGIPLHAPPGWARP